MKFVKKCISLPEDVYQYGKQEAVRRSRAESRRVGFSNVISDALVEKRNGRKLAASHGRQN